MARKILEIRAFPNGKDHYEDFINGNFVAIGWPKIGDISGADEQIVRNKLKEHYDNLTDDNPSDKSKLTQITNFFMRLKDLNEDDIILIPYSKNSKRTITITRVTGPYRYNQNYIENHMAHQVPVELLKIISRDDIKDGIPSLQNSLNARLTLTKIKDIPEYHEFIDEVTSLIEESVEDEFNFDKERSSYSKKMAVIKNDLNNNNTNPLTKKALILCAFILQESYLKRLTTAEIFNQEKENNNRPSVMSNFVVDRLDEKRDYLNAISEQYFENAQIKSQCQQLRNKLAHNIDQLDFEQSKNGKERIKYSQDGKQPVYYDDIDSLMEYVYNYADNIKPIH